MIVNRFNVDLVRYLCYIFEWDNEDILKDIDYSPEKAKGTVEGVTLTIYLMLKDLYSKNMLYSDYIQSINAPQPYICGVVDINKSIIHNSLQEGKVYQNYNTLSIHTPVNLVIKYCLDLLLDSKTIRDTDFGKKIRSSVSKIFSSSSDKSSKDKDTIKYNLDLVKNALDSNLYKGYYFGILDLCRLVLENLYLADGNLDDLEHTTLFELDIQYIMQEFLRTATRHCMLRLNKTSPYESKFKGKWSMRKRDCHLKTSDLFIDILVKYTKDSDFPHLIFDSKTNKSVRNSLGRNRMQLQTYTTEYGARHNNNVIGILQYFVDSDAPKSDLLLGNSKLKSDIETLNMYTWVFQVLPDTKPIEFEDYLYNQLLDLYEL